MAQDQALWLKSVDKDALDYHERQFKNPYRSTIAFSDWLKSLRLISPKKSINVLDLGSGEGASLSYLARKFPISNFTGVEINKNLVDKGNKIFEKLKINNCKLEVGDLYRINRKFINKVDGIISLQTLSWLPEYKKPIKEMIKLNPKWIAVSSLFYDGLVECEIKVRDFKRSSGKKPEDVFYNVYSLKLIENLFKKYGYKKFKFTPFTIDVDIEKNKDGRMGTYTVKTNKGKRLQISGPLLMSWYFAAASKV